MSNAPTRLREFGARRFRLLSFTLGLLAGVSYAKPRAEHAQWYELAEQLSGESTLRTQQIIRRLRQFPNLVPRLTEQISRSGSDPVTRTFLALDVVSTLNLREMLSVLIDFSARDRSGYAYQAINAFVNATNQKELTELYRRRLFEPLTSPAAQITLIDSLARLNSVLPTVELKKLLRNPVVEVQSATLFYLRNFLLARPNSEYRALVEIPLREGSLRLRKQAEFLLRELSVPGTGRSP